MSYIRLIISLAAIIASCSASVGHIPHIVKSVPIVRYAPFYNFPNGVRSTHAVAAPVPIAPAPVQSFVRGPLLSAPAPVFPAPSPFLPAPAPVFPPQAPIFSAPAFAAPVPAFPTAPFPAYPAPAFPAPIPAPVFAAPGHAPFFPATAPAFPAHPPFYPRVAPALQAAPFSPILRPVAAPVPAPLFTRTFFPGSISPYSPTAPLLKHLAWK